MQKIRIFLYLSICLLAQITICGGRYRKRATKSLPRPASKAGVTIFDASGNTIAKSSVQVQREEDESHLSKRKVDEKNGAGNITSKLGIENVTGSKNAQNSSSPAQLPPKSSSENATSGIQNFPVPTPPSGGGHGTTLNSGALLRGFYVFVGLSVLVMVYIVFRSFRLNKGQTQMVRKYGILAHRQDVEMRPLPLEEEDEDDTTVFDVSDVAIHGIQRQNT